MNSEHEKYQLVKRHQILEESYVKALNRFTDGQETTNTTSEVDDKKSDDDQTNQIIESIATENSRDDLLQEQQHQTVKIEKIEIISQVQQHQLPPQPQSL